MTDPSTLPAWSALRAHRDEIASRHLRELFREDPRRFERFSLRFEDVLIDYSKNRITGETLRLLRAFRTGELCPSSWKPGEETLTVKIPVEV